MSPIPSIVLSFISVIKSFFISSHSLIPNKFFINCKKFPVFLSWDNPAFIS